jgi:hypothetical protein
VIKARNTTSVVGAKSPITRRKTRKSPTPQVVGRNRKTGDTSSFRLLGVQDWLGFGLSPSDARALDDVLWSLSGDHQIPLRRLSQLVDAVVFWAVARRRPRRLGAEGARS